MIAQPFPALGPDPRKIRWAVRHLGSLAPGFAGAPFGLFLTALGGAPGQVNLLLAPVTVLATFGLRKLYRRWFGAVESPRVASPSSPVLILISMAGIWMLLGALLLDLDLPTLPFNYGTMFLALLLFQSWFQEERVATHQAFLAVLLIVASFALEAKATRAWMGVWYFPLLGTGWMSMCLFDHFLLCQLLRRPAREEEAEASLSP